MRNGTWHGLSIAVPRFAGYIVAAVPPEHRADSRPSVMTPTPRIAHLLAATCLFAVAVEASAQHIDRISAELIREVMPDADRFGEASGDPPVVEAYAIDEGGGEQLVGYVFLTSDVPPEQYGYSGPIQALVGMRLDGTVTGVRVTDYRESYMSQMGDFLRRRGFQEQFRGKYIGDPFRVWGDVDGISRVTISVRALSRGVRDAARRVAAAHSTTGAVHSPADPVADPVGMSWFEMRRAGVVERFEVTEPGEGSVGISLAYVASDRLGEYFLGRIQYESAIRSMTRRGGADHIMLYALDGPRLRLFEREGWSIEQGGDTTAIESADIVTLGLPSGGVASGEATMVGVMLLKRAIDIREPFTLAYDAGEFGLHSVEYITQDGRILMAEAQAAEAAGSVGTRDVSERPVAATEPRTTSAAEGQAPSPADSTSSTPTVASSTPPTVASLAPPATVSPAPPATAGASGEPDAPDASAPASASAGAGASTGASADGVPTRQLPNFEFALPEDETFLQRTLADTSWSRVARMLAVLALATWAFLAKRESLRWMALAATVLVLGYVDGSFLSVSHITSGIWSGVGVYLRDLPLLLIVGFTVVSTLVWGRVFCGFLCPFGALQDLIDRAVPKRFQRPLPQPLHDRAVWIKYGVLAVILLPALAGSHQSLYQYFEPFGTVFFLSPSPLFWSIAAAFLLASVVVPRFYCRYACPLGAALAIGSLVSLRRIGRVEQCNHCKVCEQKCPTGAIRGPEIDFKECVRCNACEIQLIEKRGVCRHDMAEIRPRLVQLEARRVGAVREG
jgi:ferredoxin/Na+-translocating ferredoxin:NAD+ oxidoreductase RnfG subunit